MLEANPTESILCEPAQSKCTWTCHKRHFVRKFTLKMPDANPAASMLREPAQSKFTWTCHKRHFVRTCSGKMPDANPGACILCEPAQSKCTWTCHKKHFVQKLTGKMLNAPCTTSIEHRALTVTVRTPQCGHTVWGKNRRSLFQVWFIRFSWVAKLTSQIAAGIQVSAIFCHTYLGQSSL